jgi:hypothetical protein
LPKRSGAALASDLMLQMCELKIGLQLALPEERVLAQTMRFEDFSAGFDFLAS